MFQLVLYMFQFAGIVPRKREGKTTLYSTKHLDAAMKFIPKQLTDGLITLKDAVSKYNFLIPNLRYLIIRLGIQSEKIRGKIMFREADFKKSSPWLKSPDNQSIAKQIFFCLQQYYQKLATLKNDIMKRVKVTLRSRPISGGRRTLYLDYYPAVRVPETMKMIRQETLGMYIYQKPKSATQKQYNEAMLAQTEAILRVQTVINEEFGFLDRHRLNLDFLKYFRKEAQKHNNVWNSSYKHFEKFVNGKCTFAQVNVDLCVKFREYLLSACRFQNRAKKLGINTASNYYRKFRGLLAIALRDKLLTKDINTSLTRIEPKRNRIEFLTQQELYNLSNAHCEIPVLKRAALFSCLTGLRFSDAKGLSWDNIVPNLEGTGYDIQPNPENGDGSHHAFKSRCPRTMWLTRTRSRFQRIQPQYALWSSETLAPRSRHYQAYHIPLFPPHLCSPAVGEWN